MPRSGIFWGGQIKFKFKLEIPSQPCHQVPVLQVRMLLVSTRLKLHKRFKFKAMSSTLMPTVISHNLDIFLNFLMAYWISRVMHEICHILAASILCEAHQFCSWHNVRTILSGTQVEVKNACGWRAAVIRLAGFWGSGVIFTMLLMSEMPYSWKAASFWTALDAVCSDLLRIGEISGPNAFRCGNFGMLLLGEYNNDRVLEILRAMIQVTMIRGAHSGGVITYTAKQRSFYGLRTRVVNGKRTDLSKLIISKLKKDFSLGSRPSKKRPEERTIPTFFCGHTRFARSSKATIEDTHPHKWTPREIFEIWRESDDNIWFAEKLNVEIYICHTGELEYWTIHGIAYPLEELLQWLKGATNSPCPSAADSSACVAGILDLLRTQGSWYHSIRYGFLFGQYHDNLSYEMPSKKEFMVAAKAAEAEFADVAKPQSAIYEIRQNMTQRLRSRFVSFRVLGLVSDAAISRFVESAVNAFFEQDLFHAVRSFVLNAKGSFGLFVSCSLDAHRQFVLASRGENMSLAFYPRQGVVLWGSEQAAVKAALETYEGTVEPLSRFEGQETNIPSAVRLDLDDLGGEICLVDFGKGYPFARSQDTNLVQQISLMKGLVSLMLQQETQILRSRTSFHRRLVPLQGNPMVIPLSKPVKDPVGADIAEIPAALQWIQDDWHEGQGINHVTMFWFGRFLCERIKKYQDNSHDGSIDLVLTGCEVSLWLLEQFASDLAQAFPRLSVKAISANKLLGLYGHQLPVPASGHQIFEAAWKMDDTIVLIASHSGSTLASVAVSNLMHGFTNKIFVISSEFDTQVARQLRKFIGLSGSWDLRSYIFTTNVGLRTAEPSTVSVAGTHQVLTQILLSLMRQVQLRDLGHASGNGIVADDYFQLEELNRHNIEALEGIVGHTRKGLKAPTDTSSALRQRGAFWAKHILEISIAWILTMVFIVVTISSGKTLIGGIAGAAGMEIWSLDQPDQGTRKLYACLVFDSLIYLFAPQWCCLLVRIVQGRSLRHRMSGRTLIVGDIPWVAQCVEAFVSKLFACSYSAATISVHSGNPSDHLLHKMSHRTSRGCLLACGRPDGRLCSLTTAEMATCESVEQLSSIQTFGSACESLTIGHNPFQPPRTKWAIILKGNRKKYLCEQLLEKHAAFNGHGRSSRVLMFDYMKLYKQAKKEADPFLLEERKHNLRISAKENKGAFRKLVENNMSTSFQEKYFGENLEKASKGIPPIILAEEQTLSARLYETRIASLQRAVAFFVMFHQMGKDVQDFWSNVSFGLLGYDMSRTHSMMRVACNPSPVSAAQVRDQTLELILLKKMKRFKENMMRLVKVRRLQQGTMIREGGRPPSFYRDDLLSQNSSIQGPSYENSEFAKQRRAETPIHQSVKLLSAPTESSPSAALLQLQREDRTSDSRNGFLTSVNDRHEFYPTPHGAIPPSIMQGASGSPEASLPLVPFPTWATTTSRTPRSPDRRGSSVSAELVFTGPEPPFKPSLSFSDEGSPGQDVPLPRSSPTLVETVQLLASSPHQRSTLVRGSQLSPRGSVSQLGGAPALAGLQAGVMGYSQTSSRIWQQGVQEDPPIHWA